MLLVTLVGGFWLADRAMRPVRAITQAARQISETGLNRRLNLNSRDELGQLAGTFDEMLSRLESAFVRQRQFTADASHELRTPLTIVNLEADRVLSSPRMAKEYQQTLSAIRSETRYMTRMVNDLLLLARFDNDEAEPQLESLDLSVLVREVVDRLTPLADHNRVHILVGQLPTLLVCGDKVYLKQMLTNLIENAIKYSSHNNDHTLQGEVSVAVGTDLPESLQGMPAQTRSPVSSHQANTPLKLTSWVEVKDNGPGIPRVYLPNLFNRFYRVDRARSGDGGSSIPQGTGLGLSIAKGIASLHGGDITVQSEVNRGTVFTVTLPLIE